jgi:transcriptional regulator with XRE-family HTH domain
MAMTLGQFIAGRRQDMGLTQEQLADRVGPTVRQAEISRLENDRIVLLRRVRLEQIAQALDVPLGELLLRTGWVGAESIATRSVDDQADDTLRQRNAELEGEAIQHKAAAERSLVETELRQETIAALEGLVIQFRAVLNGIAVPVVAVNRAGVVVFENTAHAVFDATWSDTPALVDEAGIAIAEEAIPLARATRGEQFTMSFAIAGACPAGAFVAEGRPVLADGEGLLGVVTFQAAVPGSGNAEA